MDRARGQRGWLELQLGTRQPRCVRSGGNETRGAIQAIERDDGRPPDYGTGDFRGRGERSDAMRGDHRDRGAAAAFAARVIAALVGCGRPVGAVILRGERGGCACGARVRRIVLPARRRRKTLQRQQQGQPHECGAKSSAESHLERKHTTAQAIIHAHRSGLGLRLEFPRPPGNGGVDDAAAEE
jgi:hypothetical protein